MSGEKRGIFQKKVYWYVGGGFVLLLLLWIAFKPQAIPADTSVVQKGTFELIIEEEGNTRVKEKFTVFAPVNGVLRRVEMHAGDKVKKGQTVAYVDWDYPRKVKSPIDGQILNVQRESAGPIQMGQPILDIGDTSNLEIVSEVLTQEAVKLEPNDPVRILGWGGKTLEGKIRRIEPEAFTKISSLGVEEQRVRVIIDFEPPPEMGEGYKVQCQMVANRSEGQILVPTAALFREGQNWASFVIVNKKARKVQVELLDRSSKVGSVKSGLKEGDKVILYPPEEIQDGDKVE